MSESSTTRSPIIVFVALIVAVLVPLVAMWVSVSGGAFVPYLVAFALYFLAFHVYVPYRVHHHATFSGRNATAWAAVTFLVPVLGLVLYVVVVSLTGDDDAAS